MLKEDIAGVKIGSVMGPPFPVVEENCPLSRVSYLLKADQCVLTRGEAGVSGIITWSNFIEHPGAPEGANSI